jgi:hypothetical protein
MSRPATAARRKPEATIRRARFAEEDRLVDKVRTPSHEIIGFYRTQSPRVARRARFCQLHLPSREYKLSPFRQGCRIIHR